MGSEDLAPGDSDIAFHLEDGAPHFLESGADLSNTALDAGQQLVKAGTSVEDKIELLAE
jgi:hypothetical protein